MMEPLVTSVRDQSWPDIVVALPAYEWVGANRESMQTMEQAVLAELREWETSHD